MTANPSPETLAPLHTLMNGLQGSRQILNDVPTDVMSTLQIELTKTLRNLDDHMGNLLCLATFAQIASARYNDCSTQGGDHSLSWLFNIQQFFGPKRGVKTLDLVVLRVILACSPNCTNLTSAQATESIRLATCIAGAIEPEQRRAWISGNAVKITKLCEKVSREGLDHELQMVVSTIDFQTLH